MKRSRVQVPFAAHMVLKEWHCLNGRGDNPVTFFYSPPLPKEGWEECQYKPLVGASAPHEFQVPFAAHIFYKGVVLAAPFLFDYSKTSFAQDLH